MKAAARACLLALLLLAPSAVLAQGPGKEYPDPDYPTGVLALLPGFLAEAEALVREGDRERPWWAETEIWLTNASAATDEGRFRVALFDLETFTELLLANQLMDDAQARPNDAERKTFAIQRTSGWKQDADLAWQAYRAKLHSYDGQLRSLHTVETALYSADLALTAAATAVSHPLLAREFPKEQGFERAYVIALVRYSHTPLLKIGWADDILQAAADVEGTEPRIRDEAWGNLTRAALSINGSGPAYLEELRTLSQPVRENGEGTLAVAFALAEQRSARLSDMQMQFGDAQTRMSVLNDAARFMGRRLENTTLETPRDHGLQGVFTSDAADRTLYALEFHERGNATLGLILATWANLDHSFYVIDALAPVSPIEPAADEERDTPLPTWTALAALAAALAVGMVLRRRG